MLDVEVETKELPKDSITLDWRPCKSLGTRDGA